MRKQTGLLITAALVLSAVYVVKFTDWFGHKSIQILYTYRGKRAFFGLGERAEELTAIKVFRLAEISTNKYAHPLWHLKAEAGAPPVTQFTYGSAVPGMKPAVPGLAPEPLERKVQYRLVVEAGKIRGEKDFQIP
jgi:hypothetical protein